MKRTVLSLTLAACMAASCLCGCSSSGGYKAIDEDDDTVYTIGIVSESGNESLEQGFKDALTDTFGDKHVNLITESVAYNGSADEKQTAAETALNSLKSNNVSLILSESWNTLSKVPVGTDEETPVISTGVNDIAQTIGVVYEDAEHPSTGVNVTGITPQASVSDQMSELIEVTDDIDRVGIIYSPECSDAVCSDRQLEQYLTQAGIGYREYIVPTEYYEDLLTRSDNAASRELADIKSSDTQDPTVPMISDTFVKTLHPDYTAAQGLNWEKKTRRSLKKASEKDILKAAVRQCDALYIAGGYSQKQAHRIARAAKNGDRTSFGGDLIMGQEALVTLWGDPYDSGYKAGEEAYRILVNGENAGDIQITSQSDDSFAKLYNASYAEVLGITFPKSFHEYTSFMDTYEPGSNTERADND